MNYFQAKFKQEAEGRTAPVSSLKSLSLLLAYGDIDYVEAKNTGTAEAKAFEVTVRSWSAYDLKELNDGVTSIVQSQMHRKSPIGSFKATYNRGDFVVIFGPSPEVFANVTNTTQIVVNGATAILMGNITDTQSEISDVLDSELSYILNS